MSEVVKKMRERRASVWESAKSLADRAADESRAFNTEEQSQWDSLNSELDALDRRVKAVIDGEQRAADTEQAFAKLEGKPRNGGGGGSGSGSDADELRAFMRGEPGAPRVYNVIPEGPVNFRDLSKLSAGAGANTVPTSFYNKLMAHLIDVSAILQTNPTVLTTSSGESIQVPKTTAHTTAGIITETNTITEVNPAFGQVTLGAFKYGELIQVSQELINDTGVDLEGYLAMQAGRALGNGFGADLVVGAGTTAPRGVTIDASTGVTPTAGLIAGGGFGTQTTADQGFDILINLFHSVIAPYRNSKSCYWVMNDSTAAKVRKIKDSTGMYVWQSSVVAGEPDTILGKPVVIDPNVASVAANAKTILFGDFSQYFVRYAGGVRFERSDDFAFNQDLVTFRALLRGDGALVDLTGAIKMLVHPAT